MTRLHRRGSVIFVVMWAMAIGALVLSSVQLFSFRQSMLGRQAVSRVQARWAARGGLEYTIAIMADHTMYPVPGDAFAMVRELDPYYAGDLEAGGRLISSWDIRHFADGREWRGPMDEHSKLNINAAGDEPGLLATFQDMSPNVSDAILDWIDKDKDERALGAERNYYLSLSMPYEPRNGPMRTIGELELVAGVWPEYLRGEDWNLNNRLDPNENDSDRTWPADDPDDMLDAGWSGLMTTYSRLGSLTGSGLTPINLGGTDIATLQERLGVDDQQAQALINFGRAAGARMESLLTTQINRRQRYEASTTGSSFAGRTTTGNSAAGAAPDAATQGAAAVNVTDDQLRLVFDETYLGNPDVNGPGKINLNTASEELLLQLLAGRENLADEIVYLRSNRQEGIASLVDLIDIPAFQDDTASLEYLARICDVRSNVYSVPVKGRSWNGDVEVEIFAVVDRSTVPVRILEYRE